MKTRFIDYKIWKSRQQQPVFEEISDSENPAITLQSTNTSDHNAFIRNNLITARATRSRTLDLESTATSTSARDRDGSRI
ncbi:hypothetical protein AVEN_271902-1, partial [Araneus ventricosus]